MMIDAPFAVPRPRPGRAGQGCPAVDAGYVVRRVLYMIPVLLGVALLVFLLFNTVGEDPVRVALGKHATPTAIAELRAQWGLDKPLPMQFLRLPAPDRDLRLRRARTTAASS